MVSELLLFEIGNFDLGHPVLLLHKVLLLYFVANWSSVGSFLLIIIDINVFDTNMRGGKDDPFRNKTVRSSSHSYMY